MNNFNYNNYIGEHMSEPLEVLENGTVLPFGLLTISYTYPSRSMLLESHSDEEYRRVEDCKPLIKSPSDLTDEELLWVFGNIKGSFISRNKSTISLGIGGGGDAYLQINLKNGQINTTDQFYNIQQILNRLYSLHVSLDYEELIRTGKAVRKG